MGWSISNSTYSGPETTEKPNSPEPGEVSDPSSDLLSWSADEQTIRDQLVWGELTNNSSYSLPSGFIEGGKDYRVADIERIGNSPPPTEVNDPSEVLPVWLGTDEEKRQTLMAGDFVNFAEFQLPSGFSVSHDGLNAGTLTETTKALGVSFSGAFLDPDTRPLTGTARLTDGDYILAEASVSGSFVMTGPPPGTAILGNDASDVGGLAFTFSPSVAGVSYVETEFDLQADAGNVQYGRVRGTVVDFNGDPVPADPVAGPGYGTTTDETGSFELIAPGGESVTFRALNRSLTEVVAVQSGVTENVEFQYPKITVEVVDMDYEPIKEAPVRVGDDLYETDEDGKLELPAVPLGTYEVTVLEKYSGEFTISEQATEYVYQMGPDASPREWDGVEDGLGGVRAKLIDAVTGRPIQDVRLVDESSDAAMSSASDGEAKILTPKVGGEINALVARGSPRYKTTRVEGDLPESTMLERTIELEPRTVVSNI